jgi:hypothetical protein
MGPESNYGGDFMKISFRHWVKYAFGILVFIAAFSLIHFVGSSGSLRPGVVEAKITQETAIFDKAHPEIQSAIIVQDRYTHTLMGIPEVVGTATGLTEAGKPAIVVFTKDMVRAGVIPEHLEGIPVIVKITGEIFAMKAPSATKIKVKPTTWFPRPVPIGVSTGNEGECSAGTIGARIKDATSVYALSNNHVYALENTAPIGSRILQPGLYDTNCVLDPKNVIGTLADFEPIIFSTSASNTIDAAIALSSTDLLDKATPSDGYGTPKSTTVSPSINQSVQKYGRTTALTKGTIVGINATVDVSYSSGTARFVNQIVVYSSKPFIKPGDSGSLLVTYPGGNPVGLLFAGNASGSYAIANPINDVLKRFGVIIDGE